MAHTQTVQQIYAAFGRGDVPAIMAALADDVDWEYGPSSTNVPWLQPRRGRDAVMGFFEALGALDLRRFEPKTFLESGSTVVALIDIEGVVRATGRAVSEEDEAHIWHFDAAGKVKRFRHHVDTHGHWAAYNDK